MRARLAKVIADVLVVGALVVGALVVGAVILGAAGGHSFAQQAPAANSGASFQDGLAEMEAGRINEAVAIWSELAEQGSVEAQYGLALVFESGAPGIAPDPLLAVSYYQRAAQGGLPEAQTNLGLLYAEGRGVIESQEKAVELWTQAAKKNNAIAQFNLGLAYFSGRGIEADTDEALGLVLVAALQGLPQAHYAMGQFYLRGLGLAQDEGLALAFLQQAKLGGNDAADAFVADLKARGVLEANLNDPAVQAKLPKLPRLVAQREILDTEPLQDQALPQSSAAGTSSPSAPLVTPGSGTVNVPRLPEQKTAGAGGQASQLVPAPIPLDDGQASGQASNQAANQAGNQAANQANSFQTFDGSPPLINPSLLAKGALDFSGLQLGNVDTQLLQSNGQPAANQTGAAADLETVPAIPAPRLADSGNQNLTGASSAGSGSMAAALSESPLQGASGTALLGAPGATPLLGSQGGDQADDGDLSLPVPQPLTVQPQQVQPQQVQPQQATGAAGLNGQGQNGQGQNGQRLGPLRPQSQNQIQNLAGIQPTYPANRSTAAPVGSAPSAQPVGNASFQPSPEGMMILVGPKPQGVPFVLWVGTVETSKEGADLWISALKSEPSILGGLEAILEPVTIGRKQGFRVVAGPIPDEKLGWQVCNAVKAGSLGFFCKVRAL